MADHVHRNAHLLPGLTPQDRSRITVLELGDLTGSKPPAITAAKLKAMGEALTRRMVDGWPRLDAVFARYRDALMASGHRGRSADQYGILLACAHLALHDDAEPESDYFDLWCERLPPERDAARDHENCVAHLMTAPIDPYRGGGRRTVAQWLQDARSGDQGQPAEANKVLETYGLSVEIEPAPGGGQTPLRWLYVANTHRGLAQLFEGSHWSAAAARRTPGCSRFAASPTRRRPRSAALPAWDPARPSSRSITCSMATELFDDFAFCNKYWRGRQQSSAPIPAGCPAMFVLPDAGKSRLPRSCHARIRPAWQLFPCVYKRI